MIENWNSCWELFLPHHEHIGRSSEPGSSVGQKSASYELLTSGWNSIDSSFKNSLKSQTESDWYKNCRRISFQYILLGVETGSISIWVVHGSIVALVEPLPCDYIEDGRFTHNHDKRDGHIYRHKARHSPVEWDGLASIRMLDWLHYPSRFSVFFELSLAHTFFLRLESGLDFFGFTVLERSCEEKTKNEREATEGWLYLWNRRLCPSKRRGCIRVHRSDSKPAQEIVFIFPFKIS